MLLLGAVRHIINIQNIMHTGYPRLTRAHTPDASEEVRAIPFPPCGENSIMLSPSYFFLANPLRWALLGVREKGLPFSHRQKKLAPFRFRLSAKTAFCAFLLPLQIKPTLLGFDLISGGYDTSAPQKPKITRKSIAVRCKQFCRGRKAARRRKGRREYFVYLQGL